MNASSYSFSGWLWFRRGLRLAVIVGLINAAWYAWNVFSQYNDDRDEWTRMRLVHECAARASDNDLNKHINEFGNINVKGVFCSERDFWVSPEEIAAVRNKTADFETVFKAFDGPGTGAMFGLGFLATIVAAMIGIGAIKAARWVWVGSVS